MHTGAPLRFVPFRSKRDNPFDDLPQSQQVQYLRRYLRDLGAKTILEEPNYFDRDYLSEFSTFYSTSSTGYDNVCSRLHFFSEPVDRDDLQAAAGGDGPATERLNRLYLGFIVIRPIPAAPLGRTVLSWYPDPPAKAAIPRITDPSREYVAHVVGVPLKVVGLGWQQQDTAVGACATIALWSVLHSSALDDHHAIPTTAAITKAAHRTASLGHRVFPSDGLTISQLCEAIKEHGLSPVVLRGDVDGDPINGFSRQRFASSCSAFIRSGFPVLLLGHLGRHGRHAVSAVGFRSCEPPAVAAGRIAHQDRDVPHVYIHDDNLGPNVRFKVVATSGPSGRPRRGTPPREYVELQLDPPRKSRLTGTFRDYGNFIPTEIVAAVPEDLRTSPDVLHDAGIRAASAISLVTEQLAIAQKTPLPGLTYTTRFLVLPDYLREELVFLPAKIRGRIRFELCEKVRPMSLRLGVVRIADGAVPLVDVLYDTTDSNRHHPAFAHLNFSRSLDSVLDAIKNVLGLDLGMKLSAF